MIRVVTKLTFKAYLKLMYTLSLRSPVTLIVLLLFLLGFVFIGIQVAMGNTTQEIFLKSTGLPAGLLFYNVIMIYRRAKRHYDSNTDFRHLEVYEFDAEKIRFVSEVSSNEYKWEVIHRVLELKNWMLIYTNNITAFMIPTEAFGSQLSEFRNLVTKNGVKAKLRK